MISNIGHDKERNIWSCGSLFLERAVNIKCGIDIAIIRRTFNSFR